MLFNKAKTFIGAFVAAMLWPAMSAHAITEVEFIDKVLAQDHLLEEAQIGLDIKQIEVDASRDNYADWKPELQMQVGYRHQDMTRDTNSNSLYTKRSESRPAEVGVELAKRFLSHPGSFAAGISRSRERDAITRYKRGVHHPDKDYQAEKYETHGYVQFKYPLLKHDGNAAARKAYRRDVLDLARQQLSFYETKEDFLSARLEDYLQWFLYAGHDALEGELLAQLRALQPADEAEAALLESAVLAAENDHGHTQTQLRSIKEKLAVLLDDPAILHDTPRFDLQKRAQLMRGDLQTTLRASRVLQRIEMEMQLKRIDIEYYRNQRLPKLDFALQAAENLRKANGASSHYDDDKTTYTASLKFSYPLGGGVSNRASLQKSLLGMRKLEISYQEKLQDLSADLQRLGARLNLDEKRLLDAIAAARQSAKIERENYAAGNAGLRDVLQSIRDVHAARMTHLDERVAYQMDRVEYDNLLDRIIIGR